MGQQYYSFLYGEIIFDSIQPESAAAGNSALSSRVLASFGSLYANIDRERSTRRIKATPGAGRRPSYRVEVRLAWMEEDQLYFSCVNNRAHRWASVATEIVQHVDVGSNEFAHDHVLDVSLQGVAVNRFIGRNGALRQCLMFLSDGALTTTLRHRAFHRDACRRFPCASQRGRLGSTWKETGI